MADLYTFNGKLYDYRKLALDADYDLANYLFGLKEGKKYEQEIRDAYADMMEGIKDGTITFNGKRYEDSTGRRTSDNNIAYGLAATHIYNAQRRLDAYIDPTKIQAGQDNSFLTGFRKALFGKGTGQEFLDLDQPVDGKRGTTERVKVLKSTLGDMKKNLDGIFTNLDDNSRDEYTKIIETLEGILNDDKVDQAEAYAASKLGISLNDLLTTEADKPIEKPKAEETPVDPTVGMTDEQKVAYQQTLTYNQFNDWVSATYGASPYAGLQFTMQSPFHGQFGSGTSGFKMVLQICLNTPSLDLADRANRIIKQLVEKRTAYDMAMDLKNAGAPSVIWQNRDGNFKQNAEYLPLILNEMARRKMLKNYGSTEDGRYIILGPKPGSRHIITYDSHNYLLKFEDMFGSDSIYDSMVTDWRNNLPEVQQANDKSRFMSVYSSKRGGILKMLGGGTTTHSNITARRADEGEGRTPLDFTYKNLTALINTPEFISLLNDLENGTDRDAVEEYIRRIKENVDLRHKSGINGYFNLSAKDLGIYTPSDDILALNKAYQNNGIDSANYLWFGSNADDYQKQNGVADLFFKILRPAKPTGTGDSWNADPTKAYMDNAGGALTALRILSPTDNTLTTNNFGEWGKAMISKGYDRAYYYAPEGASEYGQWVPVKAGLEGYDDATVITSIPPAPEDQKPVTEDLKPEDGKSTIDPNADKIKSIIELLLGTPMELKNNNWKSLVPQLLIGSERLPLTIWSNNKNRDILKEAIRPTLKEAVWKSRPIEGRYNLIQAERQELANLTTALRNQFGTDQLINTAGLLTLFDKGRTSMNKVEQQDDERKFQTRNEDQQLRNATADLYMKTANENRASENAAWREQHEVDAANQLANARSIDQRLKEVDSHILNRAKELQTLLDQTTETAIQNWHNNNAMKLSLRISNAIQAYRNAHNGDVSKMPYYNELLQMGTLMLEFAKNRTIADVGKTRGINYDTADNGRTWKWFEDNINLLLGKQA